MSSLCPGRGKLGGSAVKFASKPALGGPRAWIETPQGPRRPSGGARSQFGLGRVAIRTPKGLREARGPAQREPRLSGYLQGGRIGPRLVGPDRAPGARSGGASNDFSGPKNGRSIGELGFLARFRSVRVQSDPRLARCWLEPIPAENPSQTELTGLSGFFARGFESKSGAQHDS